MDKEQLVSKVSTELDSLGIVCSRGKGTDLYVDCEFLDAGWSTGKKSITYNALIFFDERVQTVFMRELTKEVGSGFSFGSDSESFSQTGTTLYRKVKSIQYGSDGKAYEYELSLGEVPAIVKRNAKEAGWKFKTVLKKENAMYPLGYSVPLISSSYCEGCGSPIGADAAFCENCGRQVSKVTANATAFQPEQTIPNEKQAPVAAPVLNTNRRDKQESRSASSGKPSKIAVIILGIIIIGLFLLMKISIIGWIGAIAVLAVLFILSGRLSGKGCLPLAILWIVALLALLFILVFFMDSSPQEQSPTPGGSAEALDNSQSGSEVKNREETPFFILHYQTDGICVPVSPDPQKSDYTLQMAYGFTFNINFDEKPLEIKVVNARAVSPPKLGTYSFIDYNNDTEAQNGELSFDPAVAEQSGGISFHFVVKDFKDMTWDNSWTDTDVTKGLLAHSGITSEDLRCAVAFDVQVRSESGIYTYPVQAELFPGDFINTLVKEDYMPGTDTKFEYGDMERYFIRKE